MDSQTSHAPPVVAVVVVHDPGPWFDDCVDALAEQDYPNLRHLFLVPADASLPIDIITEQVQSRLPGAYVRVVDEATGFGPTANAVLRLVEGAKGFFLICHDDVALDPDAVTQMVEELYRSNAGLVGPKLVDWDDPGILQTVGLGVDRFGEIDSFVEPGEVDQEQHDAVRDVFALPSACLLVRADLFRELGGFDPVVEFHGDDIDLCWRAHLSGARVVVVPAARARHRAGLEGRRPDLDHRLLRARSRMRTLATLTGGSRIVPRSIQLVLLTLVEMVVGLFTGRFGESWASLRALVGLVPRTPSLIARRKAVAGLRHVPEREVAGLQVRGTARLTSYLRARESTTVIVHEGRVVRTTIDRWREGSAAATVTWVLVLCGIMIGSRTFFDRGVPAVGEFLPLPSSPQRLLAQYASSWNPGGLGSTAPVPGGLVVTAVAVMATFTHTGLALTLGVVGLLVVAAMGIWRLATVFPTNRARIAALVTYAAIPLVPGMISAGRWSALVLYAVLPWMLHMTRRVAGIETLAPSSDDAEIADAAVDLAPRERTRRIAVAAVVLAVATAAAPVVLPMVVAAVVVIAVCSLLVGARVVTVGWMLVAGAACGAVAWMLNLPWSASLAWDDLVPVALAGPRGLGLRTLASFDLAGGRFAVLALALYIPLLAAVALARGPRLTWATRGAGLVLAFGAVAVLDDRGDMPFRVPEPAVLLVPVAVGLALTAAACLSAFDLDIRGRSFGWRQPLGLLANLAVAVAVLPGVLAIGDGRWHTPRNTLATLLANQLQPAAVAGDYRTLLVGDPRLIPVPSRSFVDGVGWAVIDDGPLDVIDRYTVPDTDADERVVEALERVADGSTLRAGRLLAPLGIRYIVVPLQDGVVSTSDDPLVAPAGLIQSLSTQLDLGKAFSPTSVAVFENTSWIALQALLQGDAAAASTLEGSEVLVRLDLAGAAPLFPGADHVDPATATVAPGVVHLGVPFDDHWTVTVDGAQLAARPGFGLTTDFDVGTGGAATLEYRSDSSRWAWIVLQVLLWLVVLAAASRIRWPFTRRPRGAGDGEALIDLGPADDDATDAGAAGDGEELGGWIDEVMR